MIVADARARRAEFLQRPENHYLLQSPYPLEKTVRFGPLDASGPALVPAQRDSFNRGIVGLDGHRCEARHSTFVDDNLTAATGAFIRLAIHASLQSLYELLGVSNPYLLDAVAHDKFIDRLCDPVREQLGFLINTNTISVGFPVSKRERLRDTVKQWHDERKSFNALDIARLIGVLYHATTVCCWARFILIDLQTEVKSILRANKQRLAHSRHFLDLGRLAADGSLFERNPSAGARALWRCKGRNFITAPMRYALRWLTCSGVVFATSSSRNPLGRYKASSFDEGASSLGQLEYYIPMLNKARQFFVELENSSQKIGRGTKISELVTPNTNRIQATGRHPF
jgi:hypothetical protein